MDGEVVPVEVLIPFKLGKSYKTVKARDAHVSDFPILI